jgi:hypothetical protein
VHPKAAPHTPWFDCDSYQRNTGFFRDHGAAVTWSKGFDPGADGIGFSAQTQTGYDTEGHATFWFARFGWLCGTNADDATAAQLVSRGREPVH